MGLTFSAHLGLGSQTFCSSLKRGIFDERPFFPSVLFFSTALGALCMLTEQRSIMTDMPLWQKLELKEVWNINCPLWWHRQRLKFNKTKWDALMPRHSSKTGKNKNYSNSHVFALLFLDTPPAEVWVCLVAHRFFLRNLAMIQILESVTRDPMCGNVVVSCAILFTVRCTDLHRSYTVCDGVPFGIQLCYRLVAIFQTTLATATLAHTELKLAVDHRNI